VSSTLPPGLADGFYRDNHGGLHILTLHATIFGLLKSGLGVKVVAEPLAFGYLAASRVPAGGKLMLLVQSTQPATLTVGLARGRTLATWKERLSGVPRGFALTPPASARTPGRYRLTLTVAAGKAHRTRASTVRIVAPAA